MSRSISARAEPYIRLLEKPNGAITLILTVLDLEDKVQAQELLCEEFDGSVELQESGDTEGNLCDQDLTEEDWMHSLRLKTKLDVRAIMSELPKAFGLYSFDVTHKQAGALKQMKIKVWVVPATDAGV